MSSIQCPYDKPYNSTTQTCLSNCVNNTIPMISNPRLCVSQINCPSGTVVDVTLENTCNKVGVAPTSGACPTGYTLWTPTTCYIDCPSSFQDTGITCLKKTLQRTEEQPTCGNVFYIFQNGACNFNFVLVTLAIIVFIIFFVLISFIGQKCFVVSPPQPTIISNKRYH